MINDLSVADNILWKYVDDTTLVESVSKNGTSYMQLRVDELVRQSEADGFQLNESKCKELRISFSRSGSSVDYITTNDKQIEVVSSSKLLGVVVSDNLSFFGSYKTRKKNKPKNKSKINQPGEVFNEKKGKI